MANPGKFNVEKIDVGASDRKKDHIELALQSRINVSEIDHRFYYEPLLAPHPKNNENIQLNFLGKHFKAPIWVSSMTGGTTLAKVINKNLAKVCGEFGLGMGLGSCRQLLNSNDFFDDFNVRKYMGNQPLYVNLGIAQLEQLIESHQTKKVIELINKLEADGLIIHVNPMQEWLQPEGDRFQFSSLDTIKRILDTVQTKVIVKEVGQGMGPKSLEALLSLPIEALDFGANGGTNFALLEILRSSEIKAENYNKLANIGQSAEEMVGFVQAIIQNPNNQILCKQMIISGGVTDFLDGYYYTQKLGLPSIYGQASGFLKYAMESYEILQEYVSHQISGLSLAKAFLTVK